MRFHPFLSFLAAVFLAWTDIAVEAAPPRPNIVLIFADDLGWGDVGFNGRTEWATPALDRLAAQGTVFDRWYCGSPVCAPSRAVLLTGKYTIHNGVTGNGPDLPAEETTIAEALKPAGYATGVFGKWHPGKPRPGRTHPVHPLEQGFDEYFGVFGAKEAWEHFPKQLMDGRELKPVPEGTYTATAFTDRALDFIRRKQGGPFFCYLALTEPHFHIEAPAEDMARHQGRFPEQDPARPVNAAYAAMISRMDKEIGRLLDKLEEWGLAGNTLVVFTADNGATFERGNQGASAFHDSNRPLRGQKRNLWEGGIRVPAAVRWPGRVPAGARFGQPVHMMDLFPTFLAAAGQKPDSTWRADGLDLLPFWLGQEAMPERPLFWEWRAEGCRQLAAMRGDFKLVATGGNTPELFNVKADPSERRNMAAAEEKLARRMERELNEWLETETETARDGKTGGR